MGLTLYERGFQIKRLGQRLLEMGIECFEMGEKITKTHTNFDKLNQMTSCWLNFKSLLGQLICHILIRVRLRNLAR